jgi:hypothetical protein
MPQVNDPPAASAAKANHRHQYRRRHLIARRTVAELSRRVLANARRRSVTVSPQAWV